MASRTAVAQYLAATLLGGGDRQKAVNEAAAWLTTHGKSRQAVYLAQDVAKALANQGYLFATITTARPNDATTKKEIELFLQKETKATTVECAYMVDQKIIGGVLITTPYGTLDASVKATLATIIEGVSR
jgi:F0F1-type ATP synthase delta subunit